MEETQAFTEYILSYDEHLRDYVLSRSVIEASKQPSLFKKGFFNYQHDAFVKHSFLRQRNSIVTNNINDGDIVLDPVIHPDNKYLIPSGSSFVSGMVLYFGDVHPNEEKTKQILLKLINDHLMSIRKRSKKKKLDLLKKLRAEKAILSKVKKQRATLSL